MFSISFACIVGIPISCRRARREFPAHLEVGRRPLLPAQFDGIKPDPLLEVSGNAAREYPDSTPAQMLIYSKTVMTTWMG